MSAEVAAKAAETAKKIKETSAKVEKAQRDVKFRKDIIESRLREGIDTTSARVDLKYAVRNLENQKRELDRLK